MVHGWRRLLWLLLGSCFPALAPLAIDPEIGGDAKHPRSGVFDLLKETSERDEAARKRILNQILGVPGVACQRAAIAIKLGSKRFESLDESMPGGFRRVGLTVQLGFVHCAHVAKTGQRGKKIR